MSNRPDTFSFDPGGLTPLSIQLMILAVCIGVFLQLHRLATDLDHKEGMGVYTVNETPEANR